MASGIDRDPQASSTVIGAVAQQDLVDERIRRLGLSPRQAHLNRLYAYARTQQNDDCKVEWDGREATDIVSRAAIVTSAIMPPGYTDLGGSAEQLPLRYRKPSVPCHLCKTICGRFTSLLFSEQQRPQWKVPGDPETEAWVQEVSKHYGLWAKMELVRDMGGAMGTAVVGFKFVKGRVVFEEFDARWCFPTFSADDPTELAKLEVRFMFPREERDPVTGRWVENKYWFRRVIDHEVDILWKPQPVGDGSSEPNWADESSYEGVKHNLGEVPIVWIQNLPVSDDMDGDPDCLGCYDYFDRIAELDSQAHKGAVKNAEPTPVVKTDGNLTGTVNLGSEEALKLEAAGDAHYMEMTGTGVKSAHEAADRLQAKALQTADCVLPDQEAGSNGAVTATEINKRSSSMYAKASRLRQQYGDRGVVRLMEKVIRAGRKVTGTRREGDQIVRGTILLPGRLDGDKLVPQRLGDVEGAHLELVWPPFAPPTPTDTQTKVTATVAARAARIITLGTGVRHVAADFNVENPETEIAALEKEGPPEVDLAGQSLQELREGR